MPALNKTALFAERVWVTSYPVLQCFIIIEQDANFELC